MATAVPFTDGVAQHPTPVPIRSATLCTAPATHLPQGHWSHKMVPAAGTGAPVPVRPLEVAVPNTATAATPAGSAALDVRQVSVLVVRVDRLSPRTARAAQPAIRLARLVLHLALAIVAPSTAIVEPRMPTAGLDVSQRLVLAHRRERERERERREWRIGKVRTLGQADLDKSCRRGDIR
jgi:hypothetical protein